jgi:hypothetical protein
MNTTRKKVATLRPPYSDSVVTLPTVKLRDRNSSNASIGWSERRSTAKNATSSASPAISGTATRGSPQPYWGCSISANTGPPRPNAASTAPGTST